MLVGKEAKGHCTRQCVRCLVEGSKAATEHCGTPTAVSSKPSRVGLCQHFSQPRHSVHSVKYQGIALMNGARIADIVEIKHIMLPPSPREFKDIYVVFELMETDLHQVRPNPSPPRNPCSLGGRGAGAPDLAGPVVVGRAFGACLVQVQKSGDPRRMEHSGTSLRLRVLRKMFTFISLCNLLTVGLLLPQVIKANCRFTVGLLYNLLTVG